MAEVRPVIEGFAAEVFGGFARRDQRGKGELYLRGLLLDGRRKSMQPMAERLGVDHQQLQQFVTTSAWDHTEVRQEHRQPDRGHAFPLPRAAGAPGQPQHPPPPRRQPARVLAAGRMAHRRTRTHRLLALHPAPGHPTARPGQDRQDPLAHRTRLPRTQGRPRPGPLRRPLLAGLAPPRHPRLGRPGDLHHPAPHPKSPCAGLTLYAVLRELQHLLAAWTGVCHTCRQPVQVTTTTQKPQVNST
ncbi:transposase [Saccharothrix sp. MB29]|nr:transposase [Saccharothrix sp. MB29]